VTHDRWLVSYADFITLLFGFFVVLYAFARADQKKQSQLPAAIDSAFKALGVYPEYAFKSKGKGEAGTGNSASGPIVVTTEQALASSVVKDDLNRIGRDLEQRLSGQIAQHTVIIKMGRDGLVISLREAGFFDSGSAMPRPDALSTLQKIAATLAGTPYDLRVEGHTDNVPIHNAQFDSNWELSSARANHIARILLDVGAVPPDRMSAAGYAEYHPVDSNDTAEGRANNRRVDLVIMPRSGVNFTGPDLSMDGGQWRRITDRN
jgi:chemotaxis protein MotB